MTNTRVLNKNYVEYKIIMFLAVLLAFCIFLYIYFIFSATISVSKMGLLVESTGIKRSVVSELETKYFIETSKIDLKKAKELGFIESNRVLFTTKKSLVKNTSIFDNEI